MLAGGVALGSGVALKLLQDLAVDLPVNTIPDPQSLESLQQLEGGDFTGRKWVQLLLGSC